MSNPRSSLLGISVLILAALLVGCVKHLRGPGGDAEVSDSLQIMIDNQSPAPIVVYFNVRTGTPYARLGRVPSIERRVFRLPPGYARGAKLTLRALHDGRLHNAVTNYMTLPINVTGVREVQWLIQDGRSLSPVVVR